MLDILGATCLLTPTERNASGQGDELPSSMVRIFLRSTDARLCVAHKVGSTHVDRFPVGVVGPSAEKSNDATHSVNDGARDAVDSED